MEQPPSAERLKELEEQRKSRELLERAREELLQHPPAPEKPLRESAERKPDDIPVWKPDAQGNLKKVA